jgi:hypothetical protein
MHLYLHDRSRPIPSRQPQLAADATNATDILFRLQPAFRRKSRPCTPLQFGVPLYIERHFWQRDIEFPY